MLIVLEVCAKSSQFNLAQNFLYKTHYTYIEVVVIYLSEL